MKRARTCELQQRLLTSATQVTSFETDSPDAPFPQTIRSRLASKALVFSNHAACRMDCRHINRVEVESVLARGQLDLQRSDPASVPCPRYALAEDNKLVVFADCAADTRVVTVIDTATSHPCGPC